MHIYAVLLHCASKLPSTASSARASGELILCVCGAIDTTAALHHLHPSRITLRAKTHCTHPLAAARPLLPLTGLRQGAALWRSPLFNAGHFDAPSSSLLGALAQVDPRHRPRTSTTWRARYFSSQLWLRCCSVGVIVAQSFLRRCDAASEPATAPIHTIYPFYTTSSWL